MNQGVSVEESESKCESVMTVSENQTTDESTPIKAINIPDAFNKESTEGAGPKVNTQPELDQGSSSASSEKTAPESITSVPVDCQDENLNLMLRYLEDRGFTNKRQNIKLLKKHSGEVEKVIQVLAERSTKRKERIMNLKATEEIYSSLLSDLEAKGFSQKRLNIRLLKKNANDVEKVIQKLTEIDARRQEKRRKRASRFLQEPQQADEDDEKLSELEAKGFINKRLNVRLLKRHSHDVGKVLQVLSDREARFARKRVKQLQHEQAVCINQAA